MTRFGTPHPPLTPSPKLAIIPRAATLAGADGVRRSRAREDIDFSVHGQPQRPDGAESAARPRRTEEYLAAQLVRIVETFLNSKLLAIPSLFHSDPLGRRILIALNFDLVVQHVMRHVSEQNTERLTPVFDEQNPIGATGRMRTWYTTKPCFPAIKSRISQLVGDSSWEGYAANFFEGREDVVAYAKNDHLGFQIQYMWAGSRRRYVPDFLVRLSSGKMLALEIKGTDSPQNKAKRDALNEWVKAINGTGGFESGPGMSRSSRVTCRTSSRSIRTSQWQNR